MGNRICNVLKSFWAAKLRIPGDCLKGSLFTCCQRFNGLTSAVLGKLVVMTILLTLLAGCMADASGGEHRTLDQGTYQPSKDIVPNDSQTVCSEPRPQRCTMIYNPVCGWNRERQPKDFPSGCSACSDPAIVSYQAGTCTGG